MSALVTLRGLHDDLVQFKQDVDRCVSRLPFDAADTGLALDCTDRIERGVARFAKLSFVEDVDNITMLDIARTLLTYWRNTAPGGRPSPTEAAVRRFAADKLRDEAILRIPGSPVLAAQTLATAGRIEGDRDVRLAIIRSLGYLLRTRDETAIAPSVRTEAITTLKILADPYTQSDPYVLNAANETLKSLYTIEIGPVTITPPARSPSWVSRYKVPLLVTGATALLAVGGLVWFFAAHPPER